MAHRLLLLLCVFGCTPTIRIYAETPGSEDLMTSAGQRLGIRTKVVEAPGPGVVSVEVRPQAGSVCGEALEKIVGADGIRDALTSGVVDCEPKAWTCDGVEFAAHELGHVVGLLPHVDPDDPATIDNLMHPAPRKDAQLTDQQKTRIRVLAVAFNEVCR